VSKNDRLFGTSGVPLTVPSGTKSGDPVVVGAFLGKAQTDADATTNVATVDLDADFHNFSVKGVIAGPANSAVVQGDKIYYNAAHTPKLDKDNTGTEFGIAWEPVGSGLTATIGVKIKSC
jgi:predicted RecA/RadA family phage recombinase